MSACRALTKMSMRIRLVLRFLIRNITKVLFSQFYLFFTSISTSLSLLLSVFTLQHTHTQPISVTFAMLFELVICRGKYFIIITVTTRHNHPVSAPVVFFMVANSFQISSIRFCLSLSALLSLSLSVCIVLFG